MAVAAWPQREGLVAQLLPGLLVRLGRLLKVPVCLQLSIPERTRHGGDWSQRNNEYINTTSDNLIPVYTQMMCLLCSFSKSFTFQMIIINLS